MSKSRMGKKQVKTSQDTGIYYSYYSIGPYQIKLHWFKHIQHWKYLNVYVSKLLHKVRGYCTETHPNEHRLCSGRSPEAARLAAACSGMFHQDSLTCHNMPFFWSHINMFPDKCLDLWHAPLIKLLSLRHLIHLILAAHRGPSVGFLLGSFCVMRNVEASFQVLACNTQESCWWWSLMKWDHCLYQEFAVSNGHRWEFMYYLVGAFTCWPDLGLWQSWKVSGAVTLSSDSKCSRAYSRQTAKPA